MKAGLLSGAAALLFATGAHAALLNGGFENPVIGAGTFSTFATIPGWTVTPAGAGIEVWHQPFNGVSAYEGTQFVELNSTQTTTIYQDVTGIGLGQSLAYQFAHRGRAGIDTMRFTATDLGSDGIFGNGDDTVLVTRLVSDGTTGWGFYSGSGIYALGNAIRLQFAAVSPGGSVGNFLDAVQFAVPEPGAFALTGLGLVLLGASHRRRAQA